MKRDFKSYAALAVCLCLFSTQFASAQSQLEYQSAVKASEEAVTSLASYNSFEPDGGGNYEFVSCRDESYNCESFCCNDCCECDSCCGCCSGSNGLLCRPGQFFVAAEYLHVRSTFSESVAYLTQTQAVASGTTILTNVFTELEYDYEPSYRVYGGYRLCDCGGVVQFGYTNFDSSANATGIAQPDTVVLAPDKVNSLSSGTAVVVNSGVRAQSYDLAFSKTIPLGCPPNVPCGCQDTCCDDTCCDECCCGGWCPGWDITWSAGIRYAEVDWNRDHNQVDTTTQVVGNTSSTVLDFEGGGPRWSLEGRRYLGKKQHFDLFLKGDVSLLLGNIGITNTRATVVGGTPIAINTTIFDSTQIVPVLDIAAGGTAYITDRLTISGGYLFSAWHDLGMRDTFALLNDPELQDPTDITFDDANILGFDGFFVRTEFSF